MVRKTSNHEAIRAPLKKFDLQKNQPSEDMLKNKVNNNLKSSLKFSNHPLTDKLVNQELYNYEKDIKENFDNIIPVLKKISLIQNQEGFIEKAQLIAKNQLGISFPVYLIDKTWIKPLDMKSLYAWCVFQIHKKVSDDFFNNDPLNGAVGKDTSVNFEKFLHECGFHLLDITPCSDGRLAHSIVYPMRIPFSSVRRRSHAGALFDIENTVNRWIKTEHKRYRESIPNQHNANTRYLKVVTYHFSSLDPTHHGCAAHGSDDKLAAKEGLKKLLDFREAIENSFCCGASVDLLLLGLDTDTDALRIHISSLDNQIDIDNWICSKKIYENTYDLSEKQAMEEINKAVNEFSGKRSEGMQRFVSQLIINNISQIDYVKNFYDGNYTDIGHAERFIGVGIGFKEVHLRNLTYFAHLDTVEEGSPDLDVGIKIFKGLNISRELPIPIVIRFDYSGKVPGAKERAVKDCRRVNEAINFRYNDLVKHGFLHTCLTVRDRDEKHSAVIVETSLKPISIEEH